MDKYGSQLNLGTRGIKLLDRRWMKKFLNRFVIHLIGSNFLPARRSYPGSAAISIKSDSGLGPGTTLFLKNVR